MLEVDMHEYLVYFKEQRHESARYNSHWYELVLCRPWLLDTFLVLVELQRLCGVARDQELVMASKKTLGRRSWQGKKQPRETCNMT
jgi:hypothetical protein